MRFGITPKLFGAILLTNVVMAVVFGLAMHFSLERGFREYVEAREQRRLEALAQTLATAYADHGNWEFLRGDEVRWQALTRPDRPEHRPEPKGLRGAPRDNGLPDRTRVRPPGGMTPESGASPPPHPGPAFGAGQLPPPPPHRPPPGLVLVDAQRQPVVGSAAAVANPLLEQRVVANGTTVGWLLLQEPPFAGADTRFLEQLLRTGWIVAGLALLLAAAAALPIARGLLSPIRRLAHATHQLAAGEYTLAIKPESRDELGQLVEDFNRLAATLRESEATRRAFLADVSHELRTPLAVLRGELEALQDGVRVCTPEAIKSLQAEVATLGALVDDLYDLAVADLGPGAFQFEDVDLARLVTDAVDTFSERAAMLRLTLDRSGIGTAPVVVSGDPRRLLQVLNNLLENAIRYTDPGGRVAIAVHAEGRDVQIDVMDSAPGVPLDELPKLFERLFRVEPSRSRAFGGAGLGLALCRAIVIAHGGTIEAKPSPLGGVWIRTWLPQGQRREGEGRWPPQS